MMNISRTRYKEAPAYDWIEFTYSEQSGLHPALAGRIACLCSDKKKKAKCTRGKTTTEDQKAIIKVLMADHPTWKLRANGALYNGSKCMAAAPGTSNHEYGHASDLDGWVEDIGNTELAQYGLYKPVPYEPWHYQLIESKGQAKSTLQKNWKEWCLNMGIEKLQSAAAAVGIYKGKVDKIKGPKTEAAARELLKICHEVLGIDFKTAEETIKACQNSPDYWIGQLKVVKYFDEFIMNVVNKMKGK